MAEILKTGLDVYQAQEILTDFGHPKEASSRIELKIKTRKVKAYNKQVFLQMKDKIIGNGSDGRELEPQMNTDQHR